MLYTKSSIKVLDLFSGTGGLSEGFQQSSSAYKIVAAVEMDKAAAASYEATFGKGLVKAKSIQEWLREGEIPGQVDVIIGGPPCQGFSTLGKQNEEDERNYLWNQYAETIKRTKPKYFVLENVPSFLSSVQYSNFVAVTNKNGYLKDYSIEAKILNAADYGVPQLRKRAVVIGHHKDLNAPGFPAVTHSSKYITVRDALAAVPEHVTDTCLPDNRFYSFEDKVFPGAFSPVELHLTRVYSELSKQRFSHIPEGGNRFDLPDNLKAECWKKYVRGATDVMGRLRWDKPSVTIRTEFYKPEKGRYLHPAEDRAITLYEAALLQGFLPTHKFVGSKAAIARQIGNAVPIPLARAIGKHIVECLEKC